VNGSQAVFHIASIEGLRASVKNQGASNTKPLAGHVVPREVVKVQAENPFSHYGVAFHLKTPLQGYRRLTFMMLDTDIVAVSAASVWREQETAQSDSDKLSRKPAADC
jgi:hypothetical protein